MSSVEIPESKCYLYCYPTPDESCVPRFKPRVHENVYFLLPPPGWFFSFYLLAMRVRK